MMWKYWSPVRQKANITAVGTAGSLENSHIPFKKLFKDLFSKINSYRVWTPHLALHPHLCLSRVTPLSAWLSFCSVSEPWSRRVLCPGPPPRLLAPDMTERCAGWLCTILGEAGEAQAAWQAPTVLREWDKQNQTPLRRLMGRCRVPGGVFYGTGESRIESLFRSELKGQDRVQALQVRGSGWTKSQSAQKMNIGCPILWGGHMGRLGLDAGCVLWLRGVQRGPGLVSSRHCSHLYQHLNATWQMIKLGRRHVLTLVLRLCLAVKTPCSTCWGASKGDQERHRKPSEILPLIKLSVRR